MESTMEPRILLAIDYGTTFTGLAWAQQKNDESNLPVLDGPNVLKDWPEKTDSKVPSVISYSPSPARCKQWGYSIDADSTVLRWTKLELRPRSTTKELTVLRELVKGLKLVQELQEQDDIQKEIPMHVTRNARGVVRDFIGQVGRYWREYMISQGKFVLDEVPLDIVITHPAKWSYDAINATITSLRQAFHEGLFPTFRDIFVLPEPEACALFTVDDLLRKNHHVLIPGDCFVLCDAGGGTVDLVSYRLDSVNPLRLTMVGKPTGDECGAAFVERAFLEWLQPKLEGVTLMPNNFGTGGHWTLGKLSNLLLDRFELIKKDFDKKPNSVLELPRNTKVAEGQEEIIRNGVVTLSNDDLKAIFAKSVHGTIKLIRRQIALVETTKHQGIPQRVSSVFLSGGFAENPYLYKMVKEYTDSTGRISLQRANDCWTAVVKGAVLGGLGMGRDPPIRVNLCPRHYGICLTRGYKEWRDDGQDIVKHRFTKEAVVEGQVIWLVRRGDVILPETPIKVERPFHFSISKSQYKSRVLRTTTFVASPLDEVPSNLSDISRAENQVIDLDIDVSTIPRHNFREQPKANGHGDFLTLDLVAEIEVFKTVTFTIKYGDVVANTYSINL